MNTIKAFVTIISSSDNFNSQEYSEILHFFSQSLSVEIILPNIKWNAPREYIQETGFDLETRVIVFKDMLINDDMIKIKNWSSELEDKYSIDGKRKFNINPGFLSQEGMYLLSHKPNKIRSREPFGHYFIEKQYDKNPRGLIPNKNTFSEYLEGRLDIFNNIYSSTFLKE